MIFSTILASCFSMLFFFFFKVILFNITNLVDLRSLVLKLYSVVYLFVLLLLQVIAVNGNFPGHPLNVTTNNNVIVNVTNKLDEELLITWLVPTYYLFQVFFIFFN